MNKYRKNNYFFKIKTVIWDYLGNGIVNRVININKSNKFFRLDKDKMNAFPETSFFKNTKLDLQERYRLFYFQKRETKLLSNTKGIIMLHTTYTPLKYKKMSEIQFLKEDILLSRFLYRILNINL